MPSPIDDLRAAGFSDAEIGSWSVQHRQTLTDAGFKDNEIDAYFVGGPTVPDEVPPAMLRRLEDGQQARKFENGVIQNVPIFIDLMKTPDGRTKVWDAITRYPAEFVKGTIDTLKVPGDVAKGEVDLSTPEGLDKAIGLGSLIGLGRFSKIDKTGKTSGLALQQGEQVARIDRTPTGEIVETPIGGLPKSEDFVAARQAIGGDTVPAEIVQDKLARLYKDHGIHPAEVAADAAHDVTITQDLLSKTPDLPQRFVERPTDFKIGEIRRSPDDPHDVAASRFEHGEVVGDEVVPIDSLTGGVRLTDPTEAKRVKSLAAEIGSEEGYVSRIIVDDAGTVVEGQHRLEALRELGAKEVPITRIKDLARGYDTAQMRDAIKKAGEETGKPLPSDNINQIISDSLRMIDDSGSPQAALAEWDLPKGFERHFEAAINAAKKIEAEPAKTSVPSIVGDGKPPPPPERPPSSGGMLPESPRDQILSKIDVGGKDPTTKLTLDRLYTQAVDDLHPIRSVGDEAYQAARLTRGQFGKAQQFLEHGAFDFKTYEDVGPSFRQILEPVRNDLDGLRAYMAAKRAIEIEESGRQSGMSLEAAKQVVKEGAEQNEAVAAQLAKYQANILKYLKDSGVLSPDAVKAMQAANKSYIPFYRLIQDEAGGPKSGKSFGPSNPIKKLKGSERDIVDPLESIIKNTYAYVSVAERNAVGQKVIDALKKKGAEEIGEVKKPTLAHDAEIKGYLEEHGVKAPPQELIDLIKQAGRFEEGDTISAWRNGVKESVKINDPELLAAFRNLEADSINVLTRILAAPAKALRAGATLTPDFIARNVIRDFLTAFVNTKGGIYTPIDTLKGFKSAITKDADFQNWLKSGGANATFVALDRRYMQESLQKLTAETGLGNRAWNVVRHPIQGLRMVSELAENATRIAEFKKVAKDATGREALDAAAFSSREVTLDFARIGASMRAYNMITAFANAQIQGMDRIVRAFGERPLTTTAKIAGSVTLPSVLLWWANHDDPRYKELPQWQKDLFWIVLTKDTIYRIPKPFEIGIVFGSGVERALDATVGQNPDAFKHFGSSLTSAFGLNFVPTAAQPIVEQFANRSTFADRTLIPADVEKQLPEYQYTPYTTELTKKLGQIIAAFPGVRDQSLEQNSAAGGVARALTSPILVENYIRSWSGGLGMYALQAADASLRKAGVLPDPVKPTDTLADVPFVKAFVVRYPSASAQSLQDFYDDYDKSKKFFDTWMAKAQEGDVAATDRILEAGGPRIFAQLDGIKETLSEHSKLIRDITKNPEIKAEEKRQLIDTLYYSMIEVGKAGKDMMQQIKETSATGQ